MAPYGVEDGREKIIILCQDIVFRRGTAFREERKNMRSLIKGGEWR